MQEVLDYSDRWTLDQYMERLSQLSILWLGASRDTVAPPHFHHTPLVTTLEQRARPRLRSAILPGDHAFSGVRVALAQHLLTWLDEVSSWLTSSRS